ncbi:MAG: helix-turn-helix domain-containing protein [Pseudonocardiaceae bacterium]
MLEEVRVPPEGERPVDGYADRHHAPPEVTHGCRLNQLSASLRVVAGLSGMSKSHLSQLERGERVLDRRSEVLALAEALQVAPSDITGQPYLPSNENEPWPTRPLRRYVPCCGTSR